MKIEKLARKGIPDLAAYVPGRSIEEVERAYGKKRWVKLASNENLLGPSPKAVRAMREEIRRVYFYPEGHCPELRAALARRFSLSEKGVVLSNGADNLILMIANAFVDEGDEVVTGDPTFFVYANSAQIMGGKVVKVKLQDHTHDLSAMARAVNKRTKLVFLCNPNNPTGTIVSKASLDAFLNRLPKRVVLVLDEAYCDFVEDRSWPNGADYVRDGNQVIVLRTFSKVYGLAGMRVGYALGREDLIDCLYKVREAFPVNRLANVAALAALEDKEHEARSIQMVHEGKRYLYRELEKMGLSYVPTEANFMLIDFGRDVGEVFEKLLREGVIVRPGKIWGYPTSARVTIGRMSDNRRFIQALKKVLRQE